MTRPKKPNYSQLGKKLQAARTAKKHSKNYIASQLKLKTTVITAIEQGQPSAWQGAYEIGYVRTYAKFLGVKLPDDISGADVITDQKTATLRPLKERSFVLSTLSVNVGLVLAGVGVFGYVIWQVVILTSAPPLTINRPADTIVTTKTQVTVEGKTSENTDVAINGVSILTEPDGSFNASVPLRPGVNDLSIVATNRLTKTTTVARTVVADYQIDSLEQQ